MFRMKCFIVLMIGIVIGIVLATACLYCFSYQEAGSNISCGSNIRAAHYIGRDEYWISFKTDHYFGDHLEELGSDSEDPEITGFLIKTNGLASILMSNGEMMDVEHASGRD
jgi:hypothetical protein